MPSQTLSLAQTQRLQMMLAPQLRQSLEMLQLPILELRALIQKELEQNPTIEEGTDRNERIEIEPGTGEVNEKEDRKELDFEHEFEVLAKLDDEWRDYFFQNAQNRPFNEEDDEKRQYLLDSIPQTISLQEHLMAQLQLAGLSESDRQIGELIVGSLDDDGYLTTPLADMAQSTGTEVEHLEDVLAVVQDFHPVGVGARDLRECLLLQLQRQKGVDPLAVTIVNEHLDLLGARKFTELARILKVSGDAIQNAAKAIASLDPKPGRIYSDDPTTYVLPEIVVQKVDDRYVVVLNDDQLPHVRISNHYRQLMGDAATTAEVKTYIQERIRAGVFLIKSIQQRQRTIFRIATEIVDLQQEFLENGVSHLKPLTMAEIAEKVGVHETTVSRAVSGKYMKTPNGLYELKYFFTPGIRTSDGGEVSNKTVKDMISTLVAGEALTAPLSDQDILDCLQERGIHIARRTIAKYRLMLRIPPSHMRKRY